MAEKVRERPLPLEERTVEGTFNHIVLVRPALDKCWVKNKKSPIYELRETWLFEKTHDEIKQWTKSVTDADVYLKWLLGLPYHKFWSQIVYKKDSLKTVYSFLETESSIAVKTTFRDSESKTMYKNIKDNVLKVLLRISRPVESKADFMSARAYSDLMKRHVIITVPILMGICVIYKNEPKKVREIVHTIYRTNDVLNITKPCKRAIEIIAVLRDRLKETKIRKLVSETSKPRKRIRLAKILGKNTIANAQMLTDLICNIGEILSYCESDYEILTKISFDFLIVQIYEDFIVSYKNMSDTLQDTMRKHMENMIKKCRLMLSKMFAKCLDLYINKYTVQIIRKDDTKLEDFLSLSDMLSKSSLLLEDLAKNYSIKKLIAHVKTMSNEHANELTKRYKSLSEQLENVKQQTSSTSCNVSDTKSAGMKTKNSESVSASERSICWLKSSEKINLEHLEIFLQSSSDEEDENVDEDINKTKQASEDASCKNSRNRTESDTNIQQDTPEEDTEDTEDFEPEWKKYKKAIGMFSEELSSKLSRMKKLFRDMGTGFLLLCLLYYDLEECEAVSEILDNGLPEELQSMDRKLGPIPISILMSTFKSNLEDSKSADIVESDDESQPNQPDSKNSSIKGQGDEKGKLPESSDGGQRSSGSKKKESQNADDSGTLYTLGDDEEERRKIKETVLQLYYDSVYNDDYESEKEEDDRLDLYETENVKCQEKSTNERMRSKYYQDDDDDNDTRKKNLDFCENPEVVRARAEQRRQSKQGTYSNRRNANRSIKHEPSPKNSAGGRKKPNEKYNPNTATHNEKGYKNEIPSQMKPQKSISYAKNDKTKEDIKNSYKNDKHVNSEDKQHKYHPKDNESEKYNQGSSVKYSRKDRGGYGTNVREVSVNKWDSNKAGSSVGNSNWNESRVSTGHSNRDHNWKKDTNNYYAQKNKEHATADSRDRNNDRNQMTKHKGYNASSSEKLRERMPQYDEKSTSIESSSQYYDDRDVSTRDSHKFSKNFKSEYRDSHKYDDRRNSAEHKNEERRGNSNRSNNQYSVRSSDRNRSFKGEADYYDTNDEIWNEIEATDAPFGSNENWNTRDSFSKQERSFESKSEHGSKNYGNLKPERGYDSRNTNKYNWKSHRGANASKRFNTSCNSEPSVNIETSFNIAPPFNIEPSLSRNKQQTSSYDWNEMNEEDRNENELVSHGDWNEPSGSGDQVKHERERASHRNESSGSRYIKGRVRNEHESEFHRTKPFENHYRNDQVRNDRESGSHNKEPSGSRCMDGQVRNARVSESYHSEPYNRYNDRGKNTRESEFHKEWNQPSGSRFMNDRVKNSRESGWRNEDSGLERRGDTRSTNLNYEEEYRNTNRDAQWICEEEETTFTQKPEPRSSRDRRDKNVNKSNYGNHNRKYLSDRKHRI